MPPPSKRVHEVESCSSASSASAPKRIRGSAANCCRAGFETPAQPQQSQRLLVKFGLLGPEQVGDEPAREDPAVQLDVAVSLDEAPLDETHPVVLPEVQLPREDRLSRAIRLL